MEGCHSRDHSFLAFTFYSTRPEAAILSIQPDTAERQQWSGFTQAWGLPATTEIDFKKPEDTSSQRKKPINCHYQPWPRRMKEKKSADRRRLSTSEIMVIFRQHLLLHYIRLQTHMRALPATTFPRPEGLLAPSYPVTYFIENHTAKSFPINYSRNSRLII